MCPFPILCPVTSTLNCQTKKPKLFQPIKLNYAKKGPISIRACLSRQSACWSFTSQGTQAYQQDYSTKVTSCSLVQFPCTWRTCNYIMDWGSFWHNSRVIFKHLNYCFCSQLHEGALKSLLLSQQMAGRACPGLKCTLWPRDVWHVQSSWLLLSSYFCENATEDAILSFHTPHHT